MDHVASSSTPWTDAEEFLATLPEIAEVPRGKNRMVALRHWLTELQPHIEYLSPGPATAFIIETAARMCPSDAGPEIKEIVRDAMMPAAFRTADEPPPHTEIPDWVNDGPDHDREEVVDDQPPPATRRDAATLDEWDAGDDLDLPPPRGWLLGNQFCRGFLSGLIAPGATGKSAVRLVQYMALATGRPLSGQHVFQRSRVLLVSLEDDRDELRRRIAAARMHHGVDLAELKGWLYCWTPKGIKLAELKDNARQKGQLVDRI